MKVDYAWDRLPFPERVPEAAEAGTSVAHETDEPRTLQYVDCRRPDLVEPG
ncbi:hypothetical protein [Streptomyces sp. NBC_00370]|uniref:hypothetical protein n=1 Tax=Streptomyces sp. NBC_00370 TaxID=2975728 RepID=UPI002E267435